MALTYLGYGRTTATGRSKVPGYTGAAMDVTTGHSYLGARYLYHKRFTSPDPAGLDPTSPTGLNRYVYANDNPARYTDPNGRQAIAAAVVACAATPCKYAVAAAAVGGAIAAKKAGDALVDYYDHALQNKSEGSRPLPKGLVGTKDAKSGKQGKPQNSGPLSPEHGGTGDAEKDFGKLTGGESSPAPAGKGYKDGTRIGKNGIQIRPGTNGKGPRIDIPANGEKPPETLHYPKPPPPPKIERGY